MKLSVQLEKSQHTTDVFTVNWSKCLRFHNLRMFQLFNQTYNNIYQLITKW